VGSPLHAAERIELKVSPGIIANARFQQGEDDKPAILLLHGWLQTNEFYTVARLFDTLDSSGYTILSPNLSLGIDQRTKSLPCESIHTNSINTDIDEIGQWVSWLSQKIDKPIILIGHSMGATELVAFLGQYRGDRVIKSILISITPIGPGWPENSANFHDLKRAENAIAAGYTGLSAYGVAYCKKYITTAHNLFSFYRWNYDQLHSTISKLQIPTQIIFGGEDNLINTDLLQMLASERIRIDILEGASHFFDKEFEFELHDSVESHLSNTLEKQGGLL